MPHSNTDLTFIFFSSFGTHLLDDLRYSADIVSDRLAFKRNKIVQIESIFRGKSQRSPGEGNRVLAISLKGTLI